MSSLVFEVLSGTRQTVIGRAQMDHIATLSPTHPISGHVTHFVSMDKKLCITMSFSFMFFLAWFIMIGDILSLSAEVFACFTGLIAIKENL